MGLKLFISILISLLLVVSLIDGHANSPSPAPFDSKAYLERYGYLEYARANTISNDDESSIIEYSIKTFQENFHIKPTGILDSETLSIMKTPRCGVPDIIKGINHMQARNSSKFATFPGNPKWSKTKLSYMLLKGFPEAAKFPVQLAFTEWQSNSIFIFSENRESLASDMILGFYRGEHGDGVPFDGPGGVLAHAAPPEEGIAHFDADENWSYDNVKGTPRDAMDFEMIVLHEIGHMLGLGHSSIESAIMYPQMDYGVTKVLDDDDIKGIRYLYG